MKQTLFTTTLLVLGTLFLSGCMTTGPIVDDLNHYKKGDTYENIKEENKEVIEDEQENFNESEQEKIIEDDAQESLEPILQNGEIIVDGQKINVLRKLVNM